MRELVDREQTQAYVTACLDGEHGPKVFLTALQYATAYSYGKPPQTVKLEDGRQTGTGEQAMARLVEALPRLMAMVPGARAKMLETLEDGNVVEADFEVEESDDG